MPDMDNCTCPTRCDKPDLTPITKKTLLLTKGTAQNAYLPKKMRYGLYVRTAPGLETFASKKYTALQPTVAATQNCINQSLCLDYLAPEPAAPFVYVPQQPLPLVLHRYYHRWIL